jgi:hypothetical protein
MKGGRAKPSPLKLYWCWTDDHDEDWFIVARSARQARRFHESQEGYNHGDAGSALVAHVPAAFQSERYVGWPRRSLLEGCGAEIERWQTPRIVRIGGIRYAEGMLEHEVLLRTDDIAELHGRGRPNRTVRVRPS